MPDLSGIFVTIKTSDKTDSETDDHLFLGIEGTGGGREFNLNVRDFDDFQRGALEQYNLGGVTSQQIQTLLNNSEILTQGYRVPYEASKGGKNDPAFLAIDFNKIDRVYLRKIGDRENNDDNAYRLASIDVWLFSDDGGWKKYFLYRQALLGSEYGLKIWIPPLEIETISIWRVLIRTLLFWR